MNGVWNFIMFQFIAHIFIVALDSIDAGWRWQCHEQTRYCGATFNWIICVWMFVCHARSRWPSYVLRSHFMCNNLFQCLWVWRTVSSYIAQTREKKIITINSTHYSVNAFVFNKTFYCTVIVICVAHESSYTLNFLNVIELTVEVIRPSIQ